MHTKQITTLAELSCIAGEVLDSCTKKDTAQILTLQGDLGVGKTAFTKELAKILNISGEVTSPTFVIMKSYPITTHAFFKTLVHIDAYRIESDDEMRVLGFEALMNDPTNLVCIEWPENIQNLLPRNVYSVSFTLEKEVRTITYGS